MPQRLPTPGGQRENIACFLPHAADQGASVDEHTRSLVRGLMRLALGSCFYSEVSRLS